MALSKPLHSVLEKELECGICLDKLKNPRLLTCHHSFCETCLDGCVNDSGTEGPNVECPVCRYTTTIPQAGVSGLRPDFRANKFLIALEEEHKRKVKIGSQGSKCSLCDATEAAEFCVECDQNMCTVCSQFHKKMPVCRDHELYPLHDVASGKSRVFLSETSTSKCSKHDERVKFYCKTCKTPICAECNVLDHNRADGHVCVYLKEVMPQLRRDLQELVDQVSAKKGELRAFDTDIDTIKQALAARCDLVNQRVDEEVAKIKHTLQSNSKLFQETTLGTIHGMREENDSNQKAVANVLTVLSQVSSSNDDVEVAGIYESLRESAQSVVSQQVNREDFDSLQSAVETFELRLSLHPNLKLVHATRPVTLLDISDDTEICSMSSSSPNEILVTLRNREVIGSKPIQKHKRCQDIISNWFGTTDSSVVSHVATQKLEGLPCFKLGTRICSNADHMPPTLCTTMPSGRTYFVQNDRLYRELNFMSDTGFLRCCDIAHDASSNVYLVLKDLPIPEMGLNRTVHMISPDHRMIDIPTSNITPNRVAACQDSPKSILVAQLQPATVLRISVAFGGAVTCSITEPDGSSWEKVAVASDDSDNVYVLSSVNSMSTLRVFNRHGCLLERIFSNRPEPSSATTAGNSPPKGTSLGSRYSVAALPDGSMLAAYIGGQKILVITRDEKVVEPRKK